MSTGSSASAAADCLQRSGCPSRDSGGGRGVLEGALRGVRVVIRDVMGVPDRNWEADWEPDWAEVCVMA